METSNEIDAKIEDFVKQYGLYFADAAEIAEALGVDLELITSKYGDTLKKSRANGKLSLRKKQFELAMKGSCQMQMFLGKQYLGQIDKIETNTSITLPTKKFILPDGSEFEL